MADFADLMKAEKAQKAEQKQNSAFAEADKNMPLEAQVTDNQQLSQSTGQSIKQSINQLIDQPANKVIDRPKAFYITTQVNENLDKAVQYYQDKLALRKVDRSILLTVLLSDPNLWTEDFLISIKDKVREELTNRLLSR